MGKKKKQILCAQTGLVCEWYKKGKKHRVLVRSDGEVIANNPLPLIGLTAVAAKKAAAAGALSAGAGFLTSKLLSRGEKKEKKESEARGGDSDSDRRPTTYDNLDRPNPGSGAWYVEQALRMR